MSNFLHLYRGDSIKNSHTNPGRFRSDGIRSAAFGAGGDPRNIENLGEIQVVKTHIDHLTHEEKEYYKITDFISFTEDEQIAMKWAADLKPDELLPCTVPYEETRYVFQLSIEKSDLKPLAKGIWNYNYQCTPYKREASRIGDALTTALLQQAGCGVCQGRDKYHSLLLIKPSLVLDQRYQRALKLAAKNDEWLLLPNDRMEQGQFRQTRVYLADFWQAHLFIKRGEPMRQPDSFELKYPIIGDVR